MANWMRFVLILVWIPAVAFSQSEEVTVVIEQGRVNLETQQSDLTPEEAEAVTAYLQKQVNESPFARGGRVTVVLKEETVADLKREIRQVDIKDEQKVGAALDRTWRQIERSHGTAEKPHRGGDSDSSRIVVGNEFTIGSDERLENLVVVGSTGVVSGQIENLVMIGSDVQVTDSAEVSDSLVSIGSRTRVNPNARILAEEVRVELPSDWSAWGREIERSLSEPMNIGIGTKIFLELITLVMIFALGSLYLYLFPAFHQRTMRYFMEKKGASFGYGLLGYLAFVPAMLLLVITLIGILLIPIFVSAYTLCAIVGYVTSASFVGKKAGANWTSNPYATLAIGVVLLRVIGWLPLIGALVLGILTTMGFGAVLVELIRTIRHRRKRTPVDPGVQTTMAPV